MLDLHPIPEIERDCPYCNIRLTPQDWHIPGMRMLADLVCPDCDREYYGDLAAGHGIFYPALLERDTGTVHADINGWFADLLEETYRKRVDEPLPLDTTYYGQVSNPVLLNCLDVNYLHHINKLLNSARYDGERHDLIVLVPEAIEWMVPEDQIASVWTVDLPATGSPTWNEHLADRIHTEVSQYNYCALSVVDPHPHPAVYDITAFTGVEPVPISERTDRLSDPTVTFIWRGATTDSSPRRLWASVPESPRWRQKLRGAVNLAAHRLGSQRLAISEQRRNIVATASELRSLIPSVDCRVAGVGIEGTFPDWLTDHRCEQPSRDAEISLCERYAESHVVVGIHGSHMGLPSAHAGAVVEVMPESKRGNYIGDMLCPVVDQRESLLRYRTISASAPVKTIAREVASVLVDFPSRWLRMQPRWRNVDATTTEVARIRDEEIRINRQTASRSNQD
jgi:hypothetical protein